jgi:hypothetical protein
VELDPLVLSLVKYFHVLLFVYWLGGDLGVWLTGKQMIRDDLSLDERLRIRAVGAIIDMAPRTCLVLMIPAGFTLASVWGSPLQGAALVAVWIMCLAWLWLVWQVHWKKNEPIGKRLNSIDLFIRYVVGAAILAFGAYCLVTGAPVAEKWLAAKITLYGLIIYNGIVLRKVAGNWQAAFDKIRVGGEARVEGELMMKANRRRVEPPVLTIWALVAIMGFLGVVKPF